MTNLIRFASRDLNGLQHEFDRLFSTLGLAGPVTQKKHSVLMPSADVITSDDALTIHLDLPGLTKDDLEIHIRDRALHIEGERPLIKMEENETVVCREHMYGRFHRIFSLPRMANTEAIEATFENGVLSIRVPVVEDVKPHRITIQ